MYTKTQKTKNKIFLLIITIIIILTIFILCIQTTSRYNIIDRLIIAGRNIGKNDVTTTYNNFEIPQIKINWTKDSDVTITDDTGLGTNFEMTNGSQGNNVIYYIPENLKGHQIQSFVLTFSNIFGDNFISTGMLLRLKKEGDILEGYMLSFNNKGENAETEPDFSNFSWYDECGGKSVAVWKFSYDMSYKENIKEKWDSGDYSNGIQKTLVKAIDYNLTPSENYIVTSTPDQIIIQDAEYNSLDYTQEELYSNITKIDISSDGDVGDGYGFFINLCDSTFFGFGSFRVQIFNTFITQL